MTTKLMIDRFLSWPLPESLCSDPCASMPGYPHRTGTNLMTAEQAKAMLLHVLAAAQAPAGWVPVTERLPEVGQYLLVAGPRGSNLADGYYRMTGIMLEDGIYDGYGCWLSNATHWMPLPAAPSAEGGSDD